jgi:ribosomal subunit interface protein
MDIRFTGKQVDTGESLQAHVQESLSLQMDKYFTEKEAHAHVVMTQQKGFFQVNIQIHISKQVMVSAKGSGGDAYGAYHEALEHITKRLRRHKRRLKNHRSEHKNEETIEKGRHYVMELQPLVADENEALQNTEKHDEDPPLIIAEMDNDTSSMSVSEAVMQLDMKALPFLLFKNSKNSKINLVYQREDGHIGWIDP